MTQGIRELLDLARDVATRAGELIVARRAEGVAVAASKSNVLDIVTEADRESERLIRDALSAARPGDGFYGEETGAEAGTSGLTWLVDPIDGTVNYLYGIPAYAVSIAVVEGEPDPATWRALAGVVVNPAIGETFEAMDAGGAFLDGRRLAVNETPHLSQALVATGFAYDVGRRGRQGRALAHMIERFRDVRRMGAASLDLCSVAAGRLDGYFEQGLHPWDYAAGALIAREAGARVGGIRGEREGERLVLAAAPPLFDSLETLLREHGIDIETRA